MTEPTPTVAENVDFSLLTSLCRDCKAPIEQWVRRPGMGERMHRCAKCARDRWLGRIQR